MCETAQPKCAPWENGGHARKPQLARRSVGVDEDSVASQHLETRPVTTSGKAGLGFSSAKERQSVA